MKPTLGRVVHVQRKGFAGWFAALVVHTEADGLSFTVRVFDPMGAVLDSTEYCKVAQENDRWRWPPRETA